MVAITGNCFLAPSVDGIKEAKIKEGRLIIAYGKCACTFYLIAYLMHV